MADIAIAFMVAAGIFAGRGGTLVVVVIGMRNCELGLTTFVVNACFWVFTGAGGIFVVVGLAVVRVGGATDVFAIFCSFTNCFAFGLAFTPKIRPREGRASVVRLACC